MLVPVLARGIGSFDNLIVCVRYRIYWYQLSLLNEAVIRMSYCLHDTNTGMQQDMYTGLDASTVSVLDGTIFRSPSATVHISHQKRPVTGSLG